MICVHWIQTADVARLGELFEEEGPPEWLWNLMLDAGVHVPPTDHLKGLMIREAYNA